MEKTKEVMIRKIERLTFITNSMPLVFPSSSVVKNNQCKTYSLTSHTITSASPCLFTNHRSQVFQFPSNDYNYCIVVANGLSFKSDPKYFSVQTLGEGTLHAMT